MSHYYGDIQLGDTIQWLFTTVNGSGVPTVLTGTPTATAYTDGGITQSATGVTLTASFDSVTGLNLVSVVATAGNGFAAGENIEIVLDAGTVDGNSVVGYAVGSFSIENRSNLRPTTVGNNEVDVTATGAVGIDWANVEGQGTSVNLSSTTTNLVNTTTTNTDMRGTDSALLASSAPTNFGDLAITVTTGQVTVGTNNDKTGYSLTQAFPTNFADLAITATTGLVSVGTLNTGVITATSIAASALNGKGDWNVGKTGYTLTQAFPTNFADMSISVTTGLVDITQTAADKAWSTAARTLTAATNITSTGGTTVPQTGDSFARLGAPIGASISADLQEVEGQTRVPKKNEAFANMGVYMVLTSDHVSPSTGLTLTVTRSIDGGAFGSGTGTATEIANGWYQYDASAADMNGDLIIFRFTGPSSDDSYVVMVTKP